VCKIVGLKGVSLYPGTKHPSATETAKLLEESRTRRASGLTNKALERYCQIKNENVLDIVAEIRKARKAEVIPITKKRTLNIEYSLHTFHIQFWGFLNL